MEKHIRGDKTPIPFYLDKYLSEDQVLAVEILKTLGWSIKFVRRSNVVTPTIIMRNQNNNQFAYLMPDGDLNTDEPVVLRSKTLH